MTDFTGIAHRYIDTWNETDADVRRERVTALWSADGSYVDPMAEARGRDEIAALIGGVQEQFPTFAFRLVGDVDGHHQQARFRWELGPVDAAEAPVAGFDVVTVDDDGRIVDVLGFLDRVPA